MHPPSPASDLPSRLRALREETWPGRVVTQAHLAEAFSRERSASVPLISSWESTTSPRVPPANRLEQYARFFATRRSIEGNGHRLLSLAELTAAERAGYDELLASLTALRPGQRVAHPVAATAEPSRGLWQFPDPYDIVIVCARLPRDLVHSMGSYTDPNDPDYVDLYTYADPDALIELFGHIRAVNSVSHVDFKRADQLDRDDYTKHLVLLGGVDWNGVTRELLSRVDVPVEQITRLRTDEPSGFEVTENGRRMYSPTVHSGRLLEDVAHFYRGQNPFNMARTVTICNGMFGRGTYGAVRALTDVKFRERNDDYARDQLDRHGAYSLLMRVQVVDGEVLTPDWTVAETRLHEWPEATT
ncbi:XRE family transcriptional regulator [Kutzneria sp. NPDC051319]|uniref:XRE family transcriptional regulator n=1 Tax=Kutzneria sp. NPDC051319 TaxID=3155047 RepID=UPI003447811A